MSYRLYPLVWTVDLPATTKIVLLRATDHAADDGTSIRPSIPVLAAACGLSERTAQNAMKHLRAIGVLVVVRDADYATRRPVEYRLDLAAIEKLAKQPDRCSRFTGESPAPVQVVREPVQQIHPTGAGAAPKSTSEPSNEPSIETIAPTCARSGLPDLLVQSGFNQFWEIYPRRDGRAPALKAYGKALKSGVNPADIEAGAKLFAANVERERTEARFIPMPATWLNGQRWQDESLRVTRLAPASSRSNPSILDLDRHTTGTGQPRGMMAALADVVRDGGLFE